MVNYLVFWEKPSVHFLIKTTQLTARNISLFAVFIAVVKVKVAKLQVSRGSYKSFSQGFKKRQKNV